jgi:hypothetical protein
MWADFLIALGIATLLGCGITVLVRRGGGKTERRRTKAIAEATGRRHDPLPQHEQEHAEEIHALVEEYRTGDLPRVRIRADKPLTVRDVARKYARRSKHSARRVPRSKRFDPLTSPLPVTEKAVMLPARQPQPWHLGEFTEARWRVGDVDRMVAEQKASAR